MTISLIATGTKRCRASSTSERIDDGGEAADAFCDLLFRHRRVTEQQPDLLRRIQIERRDRVHADTGARRTHPQLARSRSRQIAQPQNQVEAGVDSGDLRATAQDRKSTRLNSSHPSISYAVFCLKKKTKIPYAHCSQTKKIDSIHKIIR